MAALTSIAIGAIIAGTTVSVAGQIQQGRAATKAGERAQEVGEAQAEALEQQAKDALAIGVDQENRLRSQIRATVGAQRVGFAAQNVTLGEGSAADVAADARALGELDMRQIRQNTMRQAWGYNVEAKLARMGGAAYAAAGRSAATGAYLGAAASGIQGAGSYFAMRYGFQNATQGARNAQAGSIARNVNLYQGF